MARRQRSARGADTRKLRSRLQRSSDGSPVAHVENQRHDEGECTEDDNDDASVELRDVGIYQNRINDDKANLKKFRDDIRRMKEKNVNRQQTVSRTIATYKEKIDPDQDAFTGAIWPILTDALVPLPVDSHSVVPPPIEYSRVLSDATALHKQCEELLFESAKLTELHKRIVSQSQPQSRVNSLQESLEADKAAAAASIRAGEDIACMDIHKRLAKHDLAEERRDTMASEEQRKGRLLLNWGVEGLDIDAMDHTALGDLTTKLIKAVSKLERLAHPA